MEKVEEKKNNKKLFWWLFYSIMAVILCYLFVVVYFFYITPYNITAKLIVWPFNSDASVGKLYSDATVQIDFSYKDNQSKEDVFVSVVGMNVRENGVIITLYDYLRECDENTEFFISANDGKNYSGKLIFGDINYNLAIIKCENLQNQTGAIKLPYVNIANTSKILAANKLYISSSPKSAMKSWVGGLVSRESISFDTIVAFTDGFVGVDLVMENCYVFNFSGYSREIINEFFDGGAVLDGSGNLLGFAYSEMLISGNIQVGYCIVPVQSAGMFLDKALGAYYNQTLYENSLVESVVGLDKIEVDCHISVSSEDGGNKESFYYNGAWKPYLDSMLKFNNSDMEGGYYLLEDFVYNDEVILGKEKVISKIKIGGTIYSIVTKIDIMNVLYGAKEGQEVTFYYHSMHQNDDTTEEHETSTFVI